MLILYSALPEEGLEEKIKDFALSIYTYKHYTLINRANDPVAQKALENIRKNYQKIKSIQLTNGGFKLFKDLSEGVWITAYIAQVLGDASDFINIDADVMHKLLKFLKDKQVYPYGFYQEDSSYLRPIQGGENFRKIYLTAFVLIGVFKNKNSENYAEFEFMITDGLKTLNNPTLGFDYEKSLVAYALALADKKELANRAIDSMDWNFLNFEKSKIKALQVEIASYAVLACLKLRREDDATKAFNWLIMQRKPTGGFFSSHDTVLGLQALSAMSVHIGVQNPLINVQFTGSRDTKAEKIENLASSKFIQLPSTDRQFNILAKGRGLAYINLYAEYKLKKSTSRSKITITSVPVVVSNGLRLELKIQAIKANMAIVDVELPSGYEYSQHTVSEEVMVNLSKSSLSFKVIL